MKEASQKSLCVPWLVWLGWLEGCPINQKVMGLIPGQGTCLRCRFDPQFESM